MFHYQLLQDYVTIDEFGRGMLEELDRLAESRAAGGNEVSFWNRRSVRLGILVLVAVAGIALLGWRFTH